MKRIAIIIRTDSWYSRGIVHGMNKFALGKQWFVRLGPVVPEVLPQLRHWKPDGVIAHLSYRSIADGMRSLRKPVVNIASKFSNLPFPRVGLDSHAIGRMAADHFLTQGFRNFAFYGLKQSVWSSDRGEGFKQKLAKEGFTKLHLFTEGSDANALPGWVDTDTKASAWLRSLPKPVAIFACNDAKNHELALLCRMSGVRVPEEAALLGVDDDVLIAETAWLPLSSIAVPLERVGYEAAALLEKLMSGKRAPSEPILLPPVRVVARQSSEILAIDVPEVARALHYIREHAFEHINVKDINRAAAVNRRRLERMFRRQLGRTPHQEIIRVRVQRAKQLLSSTNLPMPLIAERSGFDSARRFTANFRATTGTSPSAYRRQFQLRDDG
jgi:LacI family transcriptional regulator